MRNIGRTVASNFTKRLKQYLLNYILSMFIIYLTEETDYQGRQSMSSVCTRYGIALAIPRVAQTPELDQCSSCTVFTLYHSLKNDYPVSTNVVAVYMMVAVKLSTSFLCTILHRSRFPTCDYRFIPLML